MGKHAPLEHCTSYSSYGRDKMPDKGFLMEYGGLFSLTAGGDSPSRQPECKAAGHIVTQSGSRVMTADALLAFSHVSFMYPRTPTHEMVPPHSRWVFPPQLNHLMDNLTDTHTSVS